MVASTTSPDEYCAVITVVVLFEGSSPAAPTSTSMCCVSESASTAKDDTLTARADAVPPVCPEELAARADAGLPEPKPAPWTALADAGLP